MVRDLLARVTSMRERRAPSETSPPEGGPSGGEDEAGTSRRTLIARGLSIAAGAVGVGVAGSIVGSGNRTAPTPATRGPAVPIALRPTEMAIYVRDVRFASPDQPAGALLGVRTFTAPHGELVDPAGTVVGSLSGGVLPGSAGQIGFQRFVFPGGTLIGMGSGSLAGEEYAIVGGTGAYAGAIGTYQTRLEAGARGRDAAFTFNVTGVR
jgi:hypothetical protein